MSGAEAREVEALFERHHPPLRRYLARLTGDPDLADDAAQEAFVRLLQPRVRRRLPEDGVRPWLFRVATNLVRDAARRGETRRRLGQFGRAALSFGDPPATPDRAAETESARRLVDRALGALSTKERTALLMREEGFKHREIAAALGTTTGSVGTLLARAIEKAAGRLGAPPEEE